ncbi:UDP-N-acetylglucosamine 2-epimerase (non-hydrolyzing) [Candidatus Pelagibacter bacterium]|nr:UDP-N-acetylglucosamine 2-epimerase (non-hydrolyzing) [Candidatus Pelagibacter bacterium]
MNKLKVITIVGTRPELIRLSRVISKLDIYCEHILIHTGQNYDYELNQVFFDDLEIRKPDYFLDIANSTSSVANKLGNLITSIDLIYEKTKPNAILVLGDTNSTLSVIPAKRRKIPIFHMEAGNRCFDQRVPEEINRKIVDHVSDINLTYSDIAREYLLSEGFHPDRIIKTGSPIFEVLNHNKIKINNSKILSELSISPQKYFLVSAHREENIDDNKQFLKLTKLLNNLGEQYNFPVIVSTHPRTMNQINKKKIALNPNVKLLKPFGYCDYQQLQINAKVVLSDSGTITEESSILNFPALNIRESHERPEGMEEGAVMLVGLDFERINQAISILENQFRNKERNINLVKDYNTLNVSEKILRLIHSYVDYVNRVVWKKY